MCFVQLGWIGDAIPLYETFVEEQRSNGQTSYTLPCEECGPNKDIVGKMYVCSVCAHFVLCDDHFKSTLEGKGRDFRDHKYFEIPGQDWPGIEKAKSKLVIQSRLRKILPRITNELQIHERSFSNLRDLDTGSSSKIEENASVLELQAGKERGPLAAAIGQPATTHKWIPTPKELELRIYENCLMAEMFREQAANTWFCRSITALIAQFFAPGEQGQREESVGQVNLITPLVGLPSQPRRSVKKAAPKDLRLELESKNMKKEKKSAPPTPITPAHNPRPTQLGLAPLNVPLVNALPSMMYPQPQKTPP